MSLIEESAWWTLPDSALTDVTNSPLGVTVTSVPVDDVMKSQDGSAAASEALDLSQHQSFTDADVNVSGPVSNSSWCDVNDDDDDDDDMRLAMSPFSTTASFVKRSRAGRSDF